MKSTLDGNPNGLGEIAMGQLGNGLTQEYGKVGKRTGASDRKDGPLHHTVGGGIQD